MIQETTLRDKEQFIYITKCHCEKGKCISIIAFTAVKDFIKQTEF